MVFGRGGRTDRQIDRWMDGRMGGRLEIQPCVLQDIGPLGPLPKKVILVYYNTIQYYFNSNFTLFILCGVENQTPWKGKKSKATQLKYTPLDHLIMLVR